MAPASFDADDLDFDHYLALHRSSPERAAKPEADFSELRQSMEAAAARMERRREERKQEELEGLRLAALESGVAFWTMFNTMPFAGHSDPTEQQMEWQMMTNLAYGSKGLQYVS